MPRITCKCGKKVTISQFEYDIGVDYCESCYKVAREKAEIRGRKKQQKDMPKIWGITVSNYHHR